MERKSWGRFRCIGMIEVIENLPQVIGFKAVLECKHSGVL